MAIFTGPYVPTQGLYTVQVFTSSGVFTPKFSGTVEVLVVAGGGGGGMDMGGGGGGGGVVYNSAYSVTANSPILITVGAGGYGGPAGSGGYRSDGTGPQPGGHQFTISATAGSNSTFGSITAYGGGYGGSSYFGYTPNNGYGSSGGSGGGASGYSDGNTGRNGSATQTSNGGGTGYGNAGGSSSGQYYSGGGGGAGAAGASGPNQANGGAGILNRILGPDYYWGGGGGGSAYSLGTGGNGGIGGGGGGAIGTTTGGAGYNTGAAGGGGSPGSWAQRPGGNGAQYTGGGGGGGSHYNSNNKGGEGGSGIVVVRYLNSAGTAVTDGSLTDRNLVLCLDAGNRKSNLSAGPMTDFNTWAKTYWTAGSGGTSYFGANGSTVENERIVTDDPWGNQSVVWEARPTSTTDADGGWNSSGFSVDKTKLYRFSVWVRRTSSSSGGTFYMGTGGGGQEVMRTDNGAEQGNPYWECEGTGALTQNQWYLVCGHIYPYNTTYTGRHPNTGMFTIAGGAVKNRDVNGCNVGQDLKWAPGTTSAIHRVYLYYCADSTTRLQFAFPRVDICDGTEPTIDDLLTIGESSWVDLSSSKQNAWPSNMYSYNRVVYNNVNAFETNDTNNQGFRVSNFTFTPSRTYEIWLNSKSYSLGWQTWFDDGGGERILFGTASNTSYVYPDLNFTANLVAGTWYQLVYTLASGAGSTAIAYLNGEQIGSGTYNSTLATSGTLYLLGDAGSEITSCYCSLIRVYNVALTADQVKRSFNATRKRFGI